MLFCKILNSEHLEKDIRERKKKKKHTSYSLFKDEEDI